LFVLAAFFIAATVAAASRIKVTLSLAILFISLSGRLIIFWITTRRSLSRDFTGALFHALISLSVVCHKSLQLRKSNYYRVGMLVVMVE
jgi:hypothetical protein